jgi:hypothetical protein
MAITCCRLFLYLSVLSRAWYWKAPITPPIWASLGVPGWLPKFECLRKVYKKVFEKQVEPLLIQCPVEIVFEAPLKFEGNLGAVPGGSVAKEAIHEDAKSWSSAEYLASVQIFQIGY